MDRGTNKRSLPYTALLEWKMLGTTELHLSRLTGTDSHPGYAENPDNWIVL
jgi:hypothetical protein